MTHKATVESSELFGYTTNNSEIYRQAITPIINNLRKKAQKGIYNSDKAIDLWYHVSTMASDKYGKDYGYTFSVQDRFTVAVDLEGYFKEDVFEGI